MKKQSALTFTASPIEGLHALEHAVAQRFNWRIMTGGEGDQPRFMIEKQVRYDLIRSWPLHALYQIMGSFKKSQSGETTLQYVVSGQSVVPFFQASVYICVLLVVTLFLGSIVFSSGINGNPIGILLLGVMVVTIVVYGLIAYRNYQGHLRELNAFMEEFAQRMGTAQNTSSST